jgi:hypothetical protein
MHKGNKITHYFYNYKETQMKRCAGNIITSIVYFLTWNRHQFFSDSLGLMALEEFEAQQIFFAVGRFSSLKTQPPFFPLERRYDKNEGKRDWT